MYTGVQISPQSMFKAFSLAQKVPCVSLQSIPVPTSNPRKPVTYFLTLQWAFLDFHISEILQYGVLYAWLSYLA